MKGPIKAVIVGAGNRAEVYANLSLEKTDKLKIVGIVEPDDGRKNLVCLTRIVLKPLKNSLQEINLPMR